MQLSAGLKHAALMGAKEVFLEWVDVHAEDPEEALAGLGASYQDVITPDMFTEDEVRGFIDDLAAWDDRSIDPTHKARVRRFHTLVCEAGIEIARALIAEATGTGDVPERVQPFVAELAPLIEELKRAIAAGTFSDSDFDLRAAILG